MSGTLLRRRLLALPVVGVVLVLLAALAIGAVLQVNRWTDQRTVGQAVDSAEVISDLAVRSHVEPHHRLGITTPNLLQVFDIQQDVNRLHADRRLVGLSVWRTDGTTLFSDAGRPASERVLPPGAGDRAAAGESWVQRDGDSLAVFLPYLDSGGRGVVVTEVRLPELAQSSAIRTANRVVTACLVSLTVMVSLVVVTLRRRLVLRERQARQDALTGLLSRRALLADAGQLLERRPGTGLVALLLLDLDGFKTINDTLGHAAGDALLRQVADSLSSAVRESDLVARLGGDEFAVVVSDVPTPAAAVKIASEVLRSLREASFCVQQVSLTVDASIGVAVHPHDGRTVEQLLQHADVAMYQAKRGHHGVRAYDPATDRHDVGQLAVLIELREAMTTDQLVLHYQPQIDLRTGVVIAAEALVRWQHPTRGLVMPDAFIPLAEPTGLIFPLTDRVLAVAVAQAVTWRQEGTAMRVAVNVSPRSLLEGDLPARVLQVLTEHGLPPEMLELEITETAVMTDPARAAGVLRRLVELGVRISIDDFGAGYSSLAYLRLLPVAALKLDKTLVTHLLDRPADEAVTEAVIGLGHRLGLEVLAEGVETAEVQQRLLEMGCDQAQGYGISRPLPPQQLAAFLARTDCSGVLTPGARA